MFYDTSVETCGKPDITILVARSSVSLFFLQQMANFVGEKGFRQPDSTYN